ncbi:MAG: hypothetical protein ACI4C7_03905 [Clostridia bacterium]|nr:hypothetical protein [Clostridia bacterium]
MAVIKAHLTLRLDLETNAKIKIIAEQELRSASNMIDYLVRKEIQRYESENGVITLSEEDLYTE